MTNDLYGVVFRSVAELVGSGVLLAAAAYGLLVFGGRAWRGLRNAFREAWREAESEG